MAGLHPRALDEMGTVAFTVDWVGAERDWANRAIGVPIDLPYAFNSNWLRSAESRDFRESRTVTFFCGAAG